MNRSYVYYNAQTGMIHRFVQCSEEDRDLQIQPGEAWTEITGRITADHYVDLASGKVLVRPVMPAILRGRRISGVPAGAVITVEGIDYVADGSPIDMEFSLPGLYEVTITYWPFLDWRGIIENPAS